MKQVLRGLCALLLLGASASIDAISSCVLFRGPKGQLVLVLGDLHAEPRVLDYLKGFITLAESFNLREPLPMVIEVNERVLRQFKVDNVVLAQSITMLLNVWGKKNTKVALERFDPRGEFRALVEGICLGLFHEVISPSVSQEEILAYPDGGNFSQDSWRSARNKFAKTKKKGKKGFEHFTVEQFLKDLCNKQKLVHQLVKKYEGQKKVCELLRAAEGRFAEAFEAIKGELKDMDTLPLNDAVEQLYMSLKTTAELLKYYDNFNKLYNLDTLGNFYNLQLLDKVLSGKDAQPICMFVGETHAGSVAEMLAKVPGWEIVKKRVSLLIQPTCFKYNLSPLLLGQVFPQHVIDSTQEFLLPLCVKKPVKQVAKQCGFCQKKDAAMRCSACHKVNYCNKGCQKSAWKEHKKICVKVKVKN